MKKFKTLMSLTFVVLLAISVKAQYTDVDLQNAINAAAPGSTITLNTGTYVFGAVVNVNKAVTLKGNSTLFQVSGTGDRLDISADGAAIEDVQIEKTDKTGEQNIIRLRANNITIKNNTIWGQFVFGDGEVSRAMVFNAGGYSGLQIEGNTIHNLRQPAYISGTNTGNIINNYVYNTKGWVVEGGNLTFTNNIWGTNVYDIAILSICPVIYYTDIVAMSNANNSAVIEDQRVAPAVLSVVYVDASTAYGSDLGGKYHPFSTISPAITRVVSGGKILVAAGTYDEDVNINKTLSLIGAGASSTTIRGVIGGSGSTITVAASNVSIAGFSITRLGNNPTDWNLALNTAGISVQGLSFTGMVVHDNTLFGNRTAIDINSSSSHTVRNNVITDNRTGLVLRNQTDNLTLIENEITNNWTVGLVFLDASSGSNIPLQTALNCTFSNNNISGNWYGQIVDRQTGGSLPAPGTNLKNFSGNWLGTTTPVVTTANSTEPGYAAQIPVAYGGTAVPPGGQPDICGAASANIDFTPYLNSGTDTNVETVVGRGTYGFQGNFSNLWVTTSGGQTGAAGRLQEAITTVSGSTINVLAGSYVEPVQVDINKNVTILGAGAATTIVKPGFSTTLGGNVKSEAFIYIDPVATVVIKNFTFDCVGQQVNHAIQSRGALDIQDCVVKNVKHGTYMGRGIVYFGGTTNNLVKNVSMTNIERIGVHIRGNVMSPNPIVNVENYTYTGKGVGDWLDYGIEFGGGGGGAVKNANITNCKGVASVDGSTSAGILVTDYWGTGTNATVTNSALTNNTTGMAVGYGPTDNSVVVAYSNNISNNTSYGISSTNPLVNAKNNWWGDASGPYDNKTLPDIPNYNNPTGLGNAVTSFVDYQPWNLFANYYNDPLNPYKLYLTSGPTVFDSLVYPNDSWPLPAGVPFGGYVGEPNDWGFLAGTDYYVVPEVGSYFGASTIVVEWDNTQYGYAGYTAGNIYGSGYFNTLLTTSGTITRLTIDGGLLNNANQTTPSGGYIAKISLTLLKTGYAPVNFYSYNFRYYDGLGGQGGVYFTDKNAKVKNYLGDVVSTTPASQATGDGKVNVDDLNFWSASYWSGVPGFTPLYTNYKAKYDIGPTSTNTVYGMPVTDLKIQFEDLVIFAMSYGLSGNGVYPKVAPVPTEPVEVTVGKPIASGNETLVPIFLSGAVQDLRAASLSFSGSFGKLISAEKGDLLNSYTTPVMVMSRADGNNVFVDLSIVGADVNGLSEEGQLFVLRFEGKANVNVTSAELRNLANSPMLVKLNGNYKGIPTEFGLAQNYPNPFNPSTMISYQVPVAAMVQIAVFNSIGEKVGMLVNEVKEPGYYEVTWNASAMPSGVYFFRINAGEFTAVKKMILTK